VFFKIGLSFKLAFESSKSGFGFFSKVLGLQKLAFLAVAIFQVSHSQKSAFGFSQQVSFLAGSGFQNWLRGFGQSFR